MPYRTSQIELPRKTAEPGLVDDMVRQFADPYAYLRELVQNAIDAGASRIEVSVVRDPQGRVTTAVDDDGCGMTRATLEGPLVTLFSSSKENDRSKIGKYGIGCMSVLACDPIHVEVLSSRDGESFLLRLFGDHGYELETAPARPQSGTRVALLQTMTREELLVHGKRVQDALSCWCRHARLPIQLTLADADAPAEDQRTEIGQPFSAPGIESVVWQNGDTRIFVTVPELGAPSSIGYYNRGLTLLESETGGDRIEGLVVKIDSPELAHTLSRDDVRRDRTQRKLVERAHALAAVDLKVALLQRLEHAALEADIPQCRALLEALVRPVFGLLDAATVPLVTAIEGRTTMTLDKLAKRANFGVQCSASETFLSHVLAREGLPVVRGLELAPALARYFFGRIAYVGAIREELDALEVEPSDTIDSTLLGVLNRVLGAAGRTHTRALFARFGRRHGMARQLASKGDSAILAHGVPTREGPDTLYLDTIAPEVVEARRAARQDTHRAAQLLARLVLLEDGPLTATANDALLAAAAREAGDR